MRVRLLSDLHLELQSTKLVVNFKKHADVAILAGDIGNPFEDSYYQFLQKMSLTHAKVFVVAGNHEYYGYNIDKVDEQIKLICDELDICFLQKNSYIYNGITFVGCTLWSYPKDSSLCKYMNDFYKINGLTFDTYVKMHLDHKRWLEEEIPKHKKCVVITHHLPLTCLVDDKYKDHPLTLFFASDINTTGANDWCYGHTHQSAYNYINNTHYHCNPKGYERETSGWDMDYIFNIE